MPEMFNSLNEITPPVYNDHYLYAEHLQRPYECSECPSNIGLLTAADGSCDYFVNGGRHQVHQDQVFFISRGSTLAVRSRTKDVYPALLFFHSRLPDVVMFSLQYGGEVLLEKPFDTLPYDFSYLERTHADPGIFATIVSLIDLGGGSGSFAWLQADMAIRRLFEDLVLKNQEAYKHSQNIQVLKASTRLEIFKRISTAKDWMEAQYQDSPTLEAIAAIASMNSQHFLRMFKQVYSITPHQYLIDCKLKKARQLLENNDLTISDICQAIGFESAFSFSVLFKKRFGMPPSHFRRT